MTDPPPNPDTGVEPDRGSQPRMPRWVKVSGIVVIFLVLLVIGLIVTDQGGQHGPGRHGPGGQSLGLISQEAPGGWALVGHAPPERGQE